MTQSSNNFPYSYEDECISYKSLFPSFDKKDFNKLDEIYNQLDIDGEIKKLFSEYKINATEDQAALHHIYRSAYGHNISSVHENYYEIAKKHDISLTQMSLSFVNSRPFVTSNIIGASKLSQLKENIESINIDLSEEVLSEIEKIHNKIPNPAP